MVNSKTTALFVSSFLLGGFCVGADHLIFNWEAYWNQYSHGKAARAVSDSLVHGVVGGWCWVNVLLVSGVQWSWVKPLQVLLCIFIAAGMKWERRGEGCLLRFG
jgi:hypothetical protein